MSFSDLGLSEAVLSAVTESGYENPTPIQAKAIPLILEGKDVIGASQTGTGKTAAFALPSLSKIKPIGKPQVLVLEPTRELAHQVAEQFEHYGKHTGCKVALIYGGLGYGKQDEQMKVADIVVATPGRLVDHFYRGTMRFGEIKILILDEVDRMLDMGFLRDVKRIVALLPKKRQSLFFSATLAGNIVELSHTILRDPVTVSIAPETTTAEKVEQKVCFVDRENKRELMLDLLEDQQPGELTLIFSRTKHGADKLSRLINKSGIKSEAIHGNRSQPQRDKTLDRFRKGAFPVLVATDVAARGVDVKAITLVINFDLPNEQEAYVHRIGRTGRAGATGKAVSFCCEDEREFLRDIEKLIQKTIEVDDSHAWHNAKLAEEHARGDRPRSTKKSSGGGNRGGNRGGNGGGNRSSGQPAGRSTQRRRSRGGRSRRSAA